MKFVSLIFLALGVGAATSAHAESLCGWTDEADIRAAMVGIFTQEGAMSIETETLSVTQAIEDSDVVLDPAGWVMLPMVENWLGHGLETALSGVIYDVDGVDDLLAAVEAEWIADAVGDTSCGPEDLPQVSGVFGTGEDVSGRVTVIPYFSDRMVLLTQTEVRGDWGLAFLTTAVLLTRQ
jgi:hypothetical protein